MANRGMVIVGGGMAGARAIVNLRASGWDGPITLISGSSPFCETRFDGVRVPPRNLVGPLDGGWTAE